MFVCAFAGVDVPDLPEFDMSTLLTVLGGMLGIGGLRTYEKQKRDCNTELIWGGDHRKQVQTFLEAVCGVSKIKSSSKN